MPKPFKYYLSDEFQKTTLERHGFAAIRCFLKKENPIHALVGLMPFKIAGQYCLAEELRFILYSTDENAILSRILAIRAGLQAFYADGKPSAHLNSDTTGLAVLTHALICRFSQRNGSQASATVASLETMRTTRDILSSKQQKNQVLNNIFTPMITILDTTFSQDTSPVFKLSSNISDKSTQTIDGKEDVGEKDASPKSSKSSTDDGSEELRIVREATTIAQELERETWTMVQGKIDSFIQSNKNRPRRYETLEDDFLSALFQFANKPYKASKLDRAFWVIQKISELFQQSDLRYHLSNGIQGLQITFEKLEVASDADGIFMLQSLIQLLQPMSYRNRLNGRQLVNDLMGIDITFRQLLEKIITTFEPKSDASAAALSNLFEILFQSDLRTLLFKRNTTFQQNTIQATSALLRRWYQVVGFFSVLLGGGAIGTGVSLLLLFALSVTVFNPLTLLFIAAPIAAVGLIGLVSALIWNAVTGFVHRQKEILAQQESQFPKPLPIYPLDQNIYVLTTLKDWFETYDISIKSHRDLIAAFMRYPILINEIDTKRDFGIFSVCFESFDNSTELSYMIKTEKTAELFLLQADEVFEKYMKNTTVKKLFEDKDAWMRYESEIKKKVLDKIISNPKFFTALIKTNRDLVDLLNQLDADKKAFFIQAVINEQNGTFFKKLLKNVIDLEQLWNALENIEQAKSIVKNNISSDKNFFEDTFFRDPHSRFWNVSSEVINILFDWTMSKPDLLISLIKDGSDLFAMLNNIPDDKKLYAIKLITSAEHRACFSRCITTVWQLNDLLAFVPNDQKDSISNAIWATIDSDEALFKRLISTRATDLDYHCARYQARILVNFKLSPALLKTLPKHEDQIIEKLFRSEFKLYRDFLRSIEAEMWLRADAKFSPKAYFSQKNLPFFETVMQLIDLKYYMDQNKAEQKTKVIEELNANWETVDPAQRSLLVKVIDDIFPDKTEETVEKIRQGLKIKNEPNPKESLLIPTSQPVVTPSVYTQPEKPSATALNPDTVKTEEIPKNEKTHGM